MVHLVAAELAWRAVPVPLDQPVLVVGLFELEQRQAELFDGVERAPPEHVLLERADESLGAAIAFGRPDEGRGRGGAEPGDLALEVMRLCWLP